MRNNTVRLRLETLENRLVLSPAIAHHDLVPIQVTVGQISAELNQGSAPVLVAQQVSPSGPKATPAAAFKDEWGAMYSALRLTKDALGAVPQLVPMFGTGRDAEALTYSHKLNASISNKALWGKIEEARKHLRMALVYFEQAKNPHLPNKQQSALMKQGNDEVKQAKILVKLAEDVYAHSQSIKWGGRWFVYSSPEQYKQMTGFTATLTGTDAITLKQGTDTVTVFSSAKAFANHGQYAHEKMHVEIFRNPFYRTIQDDSWRSRAFRERLSYEAGWHAATDKKTRDEQYKLYLQASNFLNGVPGLYHFLDGAEYLFGFNYNNATKVYDPYLIARTR